MTRQDSVVETLRDNGVSHVDVKSEKRVLSSDNLNEFFRLTRARDIRHGVVNKLTRLLLTGKHFDTPLVVNKKNDRNRLLDGNHRYLAIKAFLERYPNRKVEVWVMYYEDLSEDEEKEVYSRWNSGTKQNTNDYVKLYWDDIPIAVWFDRERSLACRINHAWGKGVVEFKTLLSAYLTRNEMPFRGAFRGSAPDFVDECISLGVDDAKIIKAFLADFVTVFGMPDKDNIHWKQSNFYPLMRIWLDNYKRTNIENIKKAFVRVRSCPTVVFYSKYSGSMEVTVKNHDDLLRIINGHRTKNPLI